MKRMKRGWSFPTKHHKTIITLQSGKKKETDFLDQFLGSHPYPTKKTPSYKTKISCLLKNTNNGPTAGGGGIFTESSECSECNVICCLEMIFKEIHNPFFKITSRENDNIMKNTTSDGLIFGQSSMFPHFYDGAWQS